MQRVTITLDDDLADEIDNLVKKRGYQNRSEAIRDLARAASDKSPRRPPWVRAIASRLLSMSTSTRRGIYLIG